MLKYKVYVNKSFTNKYTGQLYQVGDILEDLTQERVNEINAVDKNLISTISVEEADKLATNKAKNKE